MGTSLERLDPLQRSACFHVRPVRIKLRPVSDRPLSDRPERGALLEFARQWLPGEVEGSVLALVLSMEVGRCVLLVAHPNHDPEEGRDDGHAVVYAASRPRSAQHCGSAAKRCPRPSGRRGHRAAPRLAVRVPP